MDDESEMDDDSKTVEDEMPSWYLNQDDLFHTLKRRKRKQTASPPIDDSAIAQEESAEIEETEDHEDVDSENEGSVFTEMGVPEDVIALFESAMKESKSQKELEDKWKVIIRKHSKLQGRENEKLRHRLSSLDKVFVDGFQIETNGTYRLNRAALRRSLRVQWGFGRSVRRIEHRQQRCAGSKRPSFGFVSEEANRRYNLKQKTFSQQSFFGRKAAHVTKMASKEQLQKWLDF